VRLRDDRFDDLRLQSSPVNAFQFRSNKYFHSPVSLMARYEADFYRIFHKLMILEKIKYLMPTFMQRKVNFDMKYIAYTVYIHVYNYGKYLKRNLFFPGFYVYFIITL
jgi:hypothetical protein